MDFTLRLAQARFGFVASFCRCLCFTHSSLQLLSKLSQLPIVLIFFRHLLDQILVFILQLLDDNIALLELLLNYFQLLWVSEGIFGLDYLFEVRAKTNALIHIHFDFDFCLVSPCVFNIPFQKFNLILFRLNL